MTHITSPPSRPPPSPVLKHFPLDSETVFLNHGSFGSTPRTVLDLQVSLRARMEAEPVRFFVEELEPLLDTARARMAAFIHCDPDDFAFVTNATVGVNTVVRSLRFSPGDEILTSHHEYNACNNALELAAGIWGAKITRAALPFPVQSEDQIVQAILAAVTPHTRLVLLSHITSPTGLVLPAARIIRELTARGIDTLLDSAHAAGFLPLNLRELAPTYCTGNFHKWVCAPKGSAFLYIRRDKQPLIHPLVISHGSNSKRTDRSRFRLEFDFLGTMDYSAWLATPAALDAVPSLLAQADPPALPGSGSGWPAVMQRNRALALQARDLLRTALGTPSTTPTCPDSMVGSLATVALPDRAPWEGERRAYEDPLQDRLLANWRIQVPIINFPAAPRRHVRVAAQLYNTLAQYQFLAHALQQELAGKGGAS